MGTYIYTVRAKKIEASGLTIHSLQFLCKAPYDVNPRVEMWLGKASAYWDARPRAQHVAVTDGSFREFDAVMSWNGTSSCYDTPNYGGSTGYVGWLKRDGKSWAVETTKYEAVVGKEGKIGQFTTFTTSRRGTFWTLDEAVAFVGHDTCKIYQTSVVDGKVVTLPVAPTLFERLIAS